MDLSTKTSVVSFGHDEQSSGTTVAGSLLRARTREALSKEIGFVLNREFQVSSDISIGAEPLTTYVEQGGEVRDEGDQFKTKSGIFARLCETPVLAAKEERAVFRRMNLLRYRANVLRGSLDLENPDEGKLYRFDDLLRRAALLQDHIVKANLRLVISVVKKFVDPKHSFDDLLSEGIVAILRAVEKFDYDRGFRFSTYATRAIQRQVFRVKEKETKRQREFVSNSDESLGQSQGHGGDEAEREYAVRTMHQSLGKMLNRLDDRERLLVRGRFGLDSSGVKMTFASLAERLAVSKERARQIFERATGKLRTMAGDFGLNELELRG